LACVLADPLDHRRGARVAHREALARATGAEELTSGSAVENGVAEQHRIARVPLRRPDDDAAAAHALADVVVRLADELELDAPGEERAEALSCRPLEARPHTPGRRRRAEHPADHAAQARAHGAIVAADRVPRLDDARTFERRRDVVRETLAEFAARRPKLRLARGPDPAPVPPCEKGAQIQPPCPPA